MAMSKEELARLKNLERRVEELEGLVTAKPVEDGIGTEAAAHKAAFPRPTTALKAKQ